MHVSVYTCVRECACNHQQTQRNTDRQADTHTHTLTLTHSHTHTHTHSHARTHSRTYAHTHTHTHTHTQSNDTHFTHHLKTVQTCKEPSGQKENIRTSRATSVRTWAQRKQPMTLTLTVSFEAVASVVPLTHTLVLSHFVDAPCVDVTVVSFRCTLVNV